MLDGLCLLAGFAPTRTLAESWDNVGLLIEPSSPKSVTKIGLCNDLTLDVMNEMVEAKADLIIAYHPPIFRPLKALRQSQWKVSPRDFYPASKQMNRR